MAASLLSLVLLAACGGDDAPPDAAGETLPPTTGTTPPEAPTTTEPPTTTQPPPTQPGAPEGEPPPTDPGGPPPAWIETPSGSAWMAFGSYSWAGTTFDILQPTCDDSAVPELPVGPGDPVRFVLPFEPAAAELTLGAGNDRPEVQTLLPARTIEWQGQYDGLLWLAVSAPEGEVAYQACVRVS